MKGNILHTSSAWALKEINLTFEKRNDSEIEDSIRRLKNSEDKLYKEFNTNDYNEFIKKLRALFSENDLKVLSRFEPKNLETELEKFRSGRAELYNQEVEIVLHLDKLDDFSIRGADLREALRNKEGNLFEVEDIETNMPKINLIYNYNTIKSVLNTFFKGHNFSTSREIMRNADALIDRLAAPGIDAFEATIVKKESPDYREKFIFSTIPNFPWGLSKKTYVDAKASNPNENTNEVLLEVKRAVEKIKKFITQTLAVGASANLQTAINTTWEKNFSKEENNPALFFSGGGSGNFISGVQGALGEFQAALIFTYLYQELGSSKYANIIGNIYKKGTSEQLKTDIQIADAIGLQVKNISIIKDEAGRDKFIRDIEAGSHPDKLKNQMVQGQQFLEYIANYYFNTSFQKETQSTFNQIIEVLKGYLGEIMNMAINIGIEDNIGFYLIAGRYLVPASKILEASQELLLRENLDIYSKYEGKSDEEYLEKITRTKSFTVGKTKKKRESNSPLFADYWYRSKTSEDGWEPFQKNKSLFKDLVSSRITIKTHFNILKELEQYALF